jgi:hypothetical protein
MEQIAIPYNLDCYCLLLIINLNTCCVFESHVT